MEKLIAPCDCIPKLYCLRRATWWQLTIASLPRMKLLLFSRSSQRSLGQSQDAHRDSRNSRWIMLAVDLRITALLISGMQFLLAPRRICPAEHLGGHVNYYPFCSFNVWVVPCHPLPKPDHPESVRMLHAMCCSHPSRDGC